MSAPEVNVENSRINISRMKVDRNRGVSPLDRADVGASFLSDNVQDKMLFKVSMSEKHGKE